MGAWSLIVRQNIANVSEVGKHVGRNVLVGSAGTRSLGKMWNLISTLAANVGNQVVPRNIANVFKMGKNVVLSANVQTVSMENEYGIENRINDLIIIYFNKLTTFNKLLVLSIFTQTFIIEFTSLEPLILYY